MKSYCNEKDVHRGWTEAASERAREGGSLREMEGERDTERIAFICIHIPVWGNDFQPHAFILVSPLNATDVSMSVSMQAAVKATNRKHQ